ncbi:TrmH family RNA methyltransferase [Belliella pelovolcani]|uniref:tRNA (guanosine(18)-2'-O)-methyltransferase n=1 Tax=Belliella pelovolcani TaxID=529505 RepID=A0A1N7LU68_9BACT|nr:RNA methyltransferase [Belliella pelovolcani]SIS77380.1 tRNA (guanosine-2'-O-)-methyltransferase [Belliella pelovolcani]
MDQKEKEFLKYLSGYITAHKLAMMEQVMAKRTRYFTVVLEDIYKPHNASAVLRTADCFGIQDVHIIEKKNQYKINPYVTRGAAQWVDIHKYFTPEGSAIASCFGQLRQAGYKIYATSPRPESISIHELPADHKTALVFGNEHEGVSEEVIANADGLVHIPMNGFTESFNISVSASIFLFDLQRKAAAINIPDFYISESEKEILRSKWYREIVKNSEIHEKNFFKAYEE